MFHKGGLVAIGISVGLALGILIASLVFFIIRWYKLRPHFQSRANDCCMSTIPIRINGLGTSTDFSASLANGATPRGTEYRQQNSPLSWWGNHSKDRLASASGIPRYLYKDVQKATQNFTTILGQGSFGPVYKATMATGEVVAAKVRASNSKQGEKEFQTEVTLHHRNLVNLLGYCVDKGQRMLLYEFMSNGSLANLLSVKPRSPFNLQVKTVIYPDHPQVADFGLSKEEVFNERNSGLKASMSPDGVHEILAKRLAGECNVEEVRKLANIAQKCLHKLQRRRPSIVEVSQAIAKINWRRLIKEDTMSFARNNLSRLASNIENQQVMLSEMGKEGV